MRKNSSIAVLASGGLDSDVLLADLSSRYRRVYPIYIRQGLAWESVELSWLKRFLKAVKRPEVQPLQIFSLRHRSNPFGSAWICVCARASALW